MLPGLLFLAIGAAFGVAALLAWTGRWRRWSRQFIWMLPAPVTFFPASAPFFVAIALDYLGVLSAESPVGGVALLLLFAGLVLGFWAPDWWGPRWLREENKERKAGRVTPDLQDPLTAVTSLPFTEDPGPRSSAAHVARRFGGQAALERWGAGWIVDPESGEKPHAFSTPGAVAGKLELYTDGLGFSAMRLEDRLRDSLTFVAVEADEIRAAWAVPPGTGPDGRKRGSSDATSFLARRIVPRLVVDTDRGALLFELHGAERKAERIRNLYGCSARNEPRSEALRGPDSAGEAGPETDRIAPF